MLKGYGFKKQGWGEAFSNIGQSIADYKKRQLMEAESAQRQQAVDLTRGQFEWQKSEAEDQDLDNQLFRLQVGQVPPPALVSRAAARGRDLTPYLDPRTGAMKTPYWTAAQQAENAIQQRQAAAQELAAQRYADANEIQRKTLKHMDLARVSDDYNKAYANISAELQALYKKTDPLSRDRQAELQRQLDNLTERFRNQLRGLEYTPAEIDAIFPPSPAGAKKDEALANVNF